MILGLTTTGPDPVVLQADHGYGAPMATLGAAPINVGAVMAYLDGAGGGGGTQTLRGVVRDSITGQYFAGAEVLVTEGAPPQWVHLPFPLPPKIRAGADVAAGIYADDIDGVARLLGTTQPGFGTSGLTPTFTGGPALGIQPGLAIVALEPWTPPELGQEDLARLPLDVAQAALAGAPVAAPVAAAAGWHGVSVDEDTGSFAIVRTGGPLQDLVGERIRVRASHRSVVVVVHHEQDFGDAEDEDLSLTRSAFKEIGPLYAESLTVSIEVLG